MSANDAPRTHREIFFNSDRRVGKGIATYGEFDQSTFEGLETIDDVSTDPDAMDILVDDGRVYVEITRSVVAMQSQAAHQVAMDAVAASGTARDAVRDSDLAFDTVAAVNMAIGKFAAGDAGLDPTEFADMDAVAASETAMDAVSSSATAVQSVTASPLALQIFLTSGDVNGSFWSNDTGTEAFWDHNGDLSDPQWGLDADSRHSGNALFIECSDIPSGGDYIEWTIDLSGINDLTVHEKTLDLRASNFEVIVGGDTLFSASNNNNDYEGRTVDVSGYSGSTTVEVGLQDTDSAGNETLVSDMQLS